MTRSVRLCTYPFEGCRARTWVRCHKYGTVRHDDGYLCLGFLGVVFVLKTMLIATRGFVRYETMRRDCKEQSRETWHRRRPTTNDREKQYGYNIYTGR